MPLFLPMQNIGFLMMRLIYFTDGKKFGFGFVQFNSLRNAMKAVELMNGKEILGEVFELLLGNTLG